MGVLVVTGTGTGIGKTVVTTAVAALAGHSRQTSCPSGEGAATPINIGTGECVDIVVDDLRDFREPATSVAPQLAPGLPERGVAAVRVLGTRPRQNQAPPPAS